MSKGKNEEGRIEINISKYLGKHKSEYEKEVIFMLKRKYEGLKKTEKEWTEELSEFLHREVNV